MKPANSHHVGLINHKMIRLTMSLPVGAPMYSVIETGTEAHTGSSVDFVKISHQGREEVHHFHGPTLVGLGPRVAEAERERLLLLRQQVDAALASVEGFLRFFGR